MIHVTNSETLTVTNASRTLTLAFLVAPVTKVRLYVEAQTIRYWRSGKAPTATQGFPLFDGETLELTLREATDLRMIRKDASDATVHVEYIAESAT